MVGDGWNNFKKRTGLTQHMSVKTMADKFIAMVEDGEFCLFRKRYTTRCLLQGCVMNAGLKLRGPIIDLLFDVLCL